MWTGCIVFLLLFAICFGVEWVLLPQAAEPFRWQFSVALAFLVTLVLSNVWGLVHAVGRLRLVGGDPGRWRDGQVVGISGEIRPLRQSLKAPVSARDVVVYEFQALRPDYNAKNTRVQHGELSSYGMAPCGIYAGSGMVRLVGFPSLTPFRSETYKRDEHRQRVAPFLAARVWVKRATHIGTAMDHLRGRYDAPTESTEEHFARPDGVLTVATVPDGGGLPAAGPATVDPARVERIRAELHARSIWMRETVIVAGATVTAFGVYRQAVGALEMGGLGQDGNRGIYPGTAGKVIGGLVAKAFLALVLMLALAVGAHYAAMANDGEMLRRISEALTA